MKKNMKRLEGKFYWIMKIMMVGWQPMESLKVCVCVYVSIYIYMYTCVSVRGLLEVVIFGICAEVSALTASCLDRQEPSRGNRAFDGKFGDQ